MRIGRYETVAELGRGGMADLYIGRAEGGELVILKLLRPPFTEKRVAAFLDETRLGLLFDHPNLVRTFEATKIDDRHCIAMEYLDGQPLDLLLQRVREKSASARQLFGWILAEGLAGLHHAHELTSDDLPLHIVHRDFSPENVFVTYEGRVKALDFGVAKATGRLAQSTTTGVVKGKIRYMAPEQALGLVVDRRADIFAAGAVLFEVCHGAPLWEPKRRDQDVFDELVDGEYPVAVPGETAGMNAILARALARDASERFATAGEMREELLREIKVPQGLSQQLAELVRGAFPDQRERTANLLAVKSR